MGRFGIRFLSPFEIASLHGFLCLPKEHGHLIVGNCIAVQHALLALVAGLSTFDARFHVNRCVINEMCLLSRLHADNAEIVVMPGFFPRTSPLQHSLMPAIHMMRPFPTLKRLHHQVTPKILQDVSVKLTLLRPPAHSFAATKFFCQIDDVQHVLHTDGSQSLSEILLSFELQHAGYMVAIGSEGRVIPNSMLIEQDTHVPFHRVCSTAKVLCETGKTWVVCKAGGTIDQMKTDLLGLLSHLDLVAWDLALWPVHCISVTRTHSYFSL